MRRFRPNQAFRFSDDLFTEQTAMTALPPAPVKRRLAALM
ncbi:MAG: RDD family protein, partial [Neisseria sicca]|nr:RDD family protein [Neisseria sicca]